MPVPLSPASGNPVASMPVGRLDESSALLPDAIALARRMGSAKDIARLESCLRVQNCLNGLLYLLNKNSRLPDALLTPGVGDGIVADLASSDFKSLALSSRDLCLAAYRHRKTLLTDGADFRSNLQPSPELQGVFLSSPPPLEDVALLKSLPNLSKLTIVGGEGAWHEAFFNAVREGGYPRSLNTFVLYDAGLKKLPPDFAQIFPALKHLRLVQCKHLSKLPTHRPAGLNSLDVTGCTNLRQLPDWTGELEQLRALRCNALTALPVSLVRKWCRLRLQTSVGIPFANRFAHGEIRVDERLEPSALSLAFFGLEIIHNGPRLFQAG